MSDGAKPWDDTPECAKCGGPAVPVDPWMCEGKNVRCARCGQLWKASELDLCRAIDANDAWHVYHSGTREDFERAKEADRRAKYERAMRGVW